MEYGRIPFDNRIRENVKNYAVQNLLDQEKVTDYLEKLSQVLDVELLLTDRHGEKVIALGDFSTFAPDVLTDPGMKVRVQNRTVGHLYYRRKPDTDRDDGLMKQMLEQSVLLLCELGEKTYLQRESSIYLEELEEHLADKQVRSSQREREDVLTGVWNRHYFESRMKIIDRSEVVPVAIINANINDWKFVNDHYGEEESDRLIQTIAGILKEEAKPEYVIGRVDGDVFLILIPMAADGEAEEYKHRVQDRCYTYEDPILAPSVAIGIVYKTNVEQTIENCISDAEYEMLDDKFELKHMEGYQERLKRGLEE